MQPLRIYIGYDSREPDAYDVCASSLRRYSSAPLAISALKLDRLRDRGVYFRDPEEKASTEFAFTRFLVPLLCGFKGRALFVDCDFLFRADVNDLFNLAEDDTKAVSVVQHDYIPRAQWKMDGQPQIAYPRKNWSSLMLFNNEHPSVVKNLDLNGVNRTFQSYLHQLHWAKDEEIGSLPQEWNWLEGEYDWPHDGTTPKAIHFTNGGPWFDGCKGVRFADLWEYELALLRQQQGV